MEQKIDLEIRLRELAAQAILEAQNEIDILEVEKSLLTSDQRMSCYAAQLEQQRKQLSNPSLSTDSGRGSKSGNRRSDTIGPNEDASSPSFSSLSNSQSPSKLSPVSGESANSPSLNCSHHSRAGLRHSSTNTLSAKQKAKNKKREQLMQSITSLSNIDCNMVTNNRASISISEIRIPLMWRDVDHFKGRGDYKRFAVFCLLKIDSQIYDTQLICDVDRQVTDVTFDDLVVFNEIAHNFELSLEVYSCVYLEQFSFTSTPRKLKEKLTNSVSRAMGRRLATQTASANYTKELQAYDKSYRFAMIASATLRLDDASDTVKTYDLVLVRPSAHHRHHLGASSIYNNGNNNNYNLGDQNLLSINTKDADKNTLPLFGHFCCKLLVRPDVFDKNVKSGYLRVATFKVPYNTSDRIGQDGDCPTNGYDHYEPRSLLAASNKMATLSLSSSSLHWALLRNFALYLWPVDEQSLSPCHRGELPRLEDPGRPKFTINVDKYTRLLRVSNSSLTLEAENGCFVLGAYRADNRLMDQADEISQWLRPIEQLIYDSHIWGSVLNHRPVERISVQRSRH